MPGYLKQITVLLNWFELGKLTEAQLSYALWIYEPGTDFDNNVVWQLECLFDLKLQVNQ